MKYIFYAFLVYLAYQLIFNLIIPLFRTTRKIKKGFREMAERMNQFQQPAAGSQQPAANKKNETSKEDYIDFEEVK